MADGNSNLLEKIKSLEKEVFEFRKSSIQLREKNLKLKEDNFKLTQQNVRIKDQLKACREKPEEPSALEIIQKAKEMAKGVQKKESDN